VDTLPDKGYNEGAVNKQAFLRTLKTLPSKVGRRLAPAVSFPYEGGADLSTPAN
jgi:hypothetical protein